MKDIAIFGAGGFGREVLTLIENINEVSQEWNILGFFDDKYEKGVKINEYPILGGIEEINKWNTPLEISIAIGNPTTKKLVVEKIHNKLIGFPTLIHPSVIIGSKNTVKIGKGCIVCALNVLTTNFFVEDFVILNLACTVGHDSVIKSFSSLMPCCNVSGEVLIDECVYCGTGVKIINRTIIGQNTIVGAGAVVTKPLPASCTAVGMPAKPIKMNQQ